MNIEKNSFAKVFGVFPNNHPNTWIPDPLGVHLRKNVKTNTAMDLGTNSTQLFQHGGGYPPEVLVFQDFSQANLLFCFFRMYSAWNVVLNLYHQIVDKKLLNQFLIESFSRQLEKMP